MTELQEALKDTFWSDILNSREKGQITHADIVTMVRELHIQEYQSMLKLWMEGNLFKYQKASFDMWMESDEITHKQELDRAMDYLAFECGCSEKPNEDIHLFIFRRIMKFSAGTKAEISKDSGKREVCRDFWHKENIKYKWDWR